MVYYVTRPMNRRDWKRFPFDEKEPPLLTLSQVSTLSRRLEMSLDAVEVGQEMSTYYTLQDGTLLKEGRD